MSVTIEASAVLLDMDGTLVDSSAVVERVWSDWAREHDLDPAEVIRVVHGRQGHESMAILLPERSPEQNQADNRDVLRRETDETDGVVEIAGAGEFLRALRGSRFALVTSATAELANARMGAAGLGVPQVAITAEDVSASKPDPEGFLAAAVALGVDPLACVAFEDSAAGVASARRAGMRVVGIGAAAVAHGADWTIADLSGVRVSVGEDRITLTLTDVVE
ncbi:MAG: HAD-IA family hydrolase [Microbacterium sp.]